MQRLACAQSVSHACARLQGRAEEPLGKESLSYMRDNYMQREVEIEAEEIDKNGCILGPMWAGAGSTRRNVGEELLRLGLGFGVYPVIERVRESTALLAAEAEARAAKRGVWEHYVEEVPAEEETAAAPSAGAGAGSGGSAPSGATVCEIIDGSTFCIHNDNDLPKLAAVTARLDVRVILLASAHDTFVTCVRGCRHT